MYFNQDDFNGGDVYFILDTEDMTYLIQSVHSALTPIVISYSDFINTLPTEVVEVTGCEGCILSTWNRYRTGVWCGLQYEDEMSPTKMFTTCPLKTKSITIKLKQNDTERN